MARAGPPSRCCQVNQRRSPSALAAANERQARPIRTPGRILFRRARRVWWQPQPTREARVRAHGEPAHLRGYLAAADRVRGRHRPLPLAAAHRLQDQVRHRKFPDPRRMDRLTRELPKQCSRVLNESRRAPAAHENARHPKVRQRLGCPPAIARLLPGERCFVPPRDLTSLRQSGSRASFRTLRPRGTRTYRRKRYGDAEDVGTSSDAPPYRCYLANRLLGHCRRTVHS